MYDCYVGRILNIYLVLFFVYLGWYVVVDVLVDGVMVSGCTVYRVILEVDSGSILVQEIVFVLSDDDEVFFYEWIKVVERCFYVDIIWSVLVGESLVEVIDPEGVSV